MAVSHEQRSISPKCVASVVIFVNKVGFWLFLPASLGAKRLAEPEKWAKFESILAGIDGFGLKIAPARQ